MKCIAAVVLLAFAACVQGGVIPWTGLPLAYSAVPAPVITQYSTQHLVSLPVAPRLIAAPQTLIAAPQTVIAAPHQAITIDAAPVQTIAVAAAPAPAAVVVAPAEAQYTAATRGAVHTAPLPGHAISQTSVNLAPAPGTL